MRQKQFFVMHKAEDAKESYQPFVAVEARDEAHAIELAMDKATRFPKVGSFAVVCGEVLGVALHQPASSTWKGQGQ